MLEFIVTVIFEGLILKLYKALGYSFHWLILTLSLYSKEEKDKIIEEDKSYHVWIGFILILILIGSIIYLYYLK